jgi:hypothetical protein
MIPVRVVAGMAYLKKGRRQLDRPPRSRKLGAKGHYAIVKNMFRFLDIKMSIKHTMRM